VKDELLAGLAHLEQVLSHLPGPLAAGLKGRIAELRELLVEQRAPRLVLVGRRGAGKSSLINALFGEPLATVGHIERGTLVPAFYTYQSARGSLEVLDTRGLGEARREQEPDVGQSTLNAIVRACAERPPDALLFLVKAKEIDARSDEDLADLSRIAQEIERKTGTRLPVLGVVNQCDELSPPTVRLDKPDDTERYRQKLLAVQAVEQRLATQISAVAGLRAVGCKGIVSYAEWSAEGQLVEDLRWRVDELVDFLFQQLPVQAQVVMARLGRVQKLQHDIGMRITLATAAVCAALGAVPLPFADMTPITGAQLGMVVAIGHVSGRELSVKAAGEFLVALGVNVGAGFVFRELSRGLIKWAFPGGGSAVSAAVAYAATLGLGRAAIAYFIDGRTVSDAKAEYERARQAGEASHTGSDQG
jgi:uncharacterized protein (DUF697 family)/predicted GTPase